MCFWLFSLTRRVNHTTQLNSQSLRGIPKHNLAERGKNMRITSNWREVLKIFFPTSGFGWCFDASRLTNFLLEMDFSLRSFCFQQNFSGAMCVCASRSKTKNHLRWEPTTTSSSIPVAVDWNQKNSMRVVMVLETKLTTRSRRRRKQQWQQISPWPDRCFFDVVCERCSPQISVPTFYLYIVWWFPSHTENLICVDNCEWFSNKIEIQMFIFLNLFHIKNLNYGTSSGVVFVA